MKIRLLLVQSMLGLQLLGAAENVPSRQLIVAAVGEIPVPRLRVVEAMGRRGYEGDETSTHQFFPNDWKIEVAGTSTDLALSMNLEPAGITIPNGELQIAIHPAKGDNTPPKPKTLAAATTGEPTIMVLFNREPQKSWSEGYDSLFVGCTPLDTAKPAAVVLNLSGATIMVTGQDQQQHPLAPGLSTVAPVFVNKEGTITMLPLSATDGTKTLNLDVCPIETRAPYCPLVVVYPSISTGRQARPLRVSVIQPSTAIPIRNAIAVTNP